LSKESKIKTKVPQQSEDPLGLNKYSFWGNEIWQI
jgi:hypothetical protein